MLRHSLNEAIEQLAHVGDHIRPRLPSCAGKAYIDRVARHEDLYWGFEFVPVGIVKPPEVMLETSELFQRIGCARRLSVLYLVQSFAYRLDNFLCLLCLVAVLSTLLLNNCPDGIGICVENLPCLLCNCTVRSLAQMVFLPDLSVAGDADR